MEPIQEIKAALDVADIVGEYLSLKPSGSGTYKANCPFHQERTPSFFVSKPRQSWHCFGCDEGGDIFSFVQKIEGFTFREALERLAAKAGIRLPEYHAQKDTGLKQRIYDVLDFAKRFYRQYLETSPEAAIARDYVKKRQVDVITSDLFGLGYAPDEWSSLSDAALQKGFTESELIQAGLANKREKGSGVYDRFRGRLMFPISDAQGQVIGFTARILTDAKDQPKYINTPETMVYKKSAVLYGLDKAKGAIRQEQLAVVVEGNMDVIGSHQFNVLNVVASSGTALTQEQLTLIKRFTTNVAIAFDQDNAGIAATLRGLDLARSQDFSIRIIQLPPNAGKDPDEAVRKDPQLWKEAIKQAVPIMEWVYRMGFKQWQPTTPEGKRQIAHWVLVEIAHISDPIEKDFWLRRLAKDLDTSLSALEEVLMKASPRNKVTAIQPMQANTTEQPVVSVDPERQWLINQERHILSGILLFLNDIEIVAKELQLSERLWTDSRITLLYSALEQAYTHDRSETPKPIKTGIHPPESLEPELMTLFNELAFIAERDFQGQALDVIKRELQRDVALLQERLKKYQRRHLEQSMREAERLNDTERMSELLKQFQELT